MVLSRFFGVDCFKIHILWYKWTMSANLLVSVNDILVLIQFLVNFVLRFLLNTQLFKKALVNTQFLENTKEIKMIYINVLPFWQNPLSHPQKKILVKLRSTKILNNMCISMLLKNFCLCHEWRGRWPIPGLYLFHL